MLLRPVALTLHSVEGRDPPGHAVDEPAHVGEVVRHAGQASDDGTDLPARPPALREAVGSRALAEGTTNASTRPHVGVQRREETSGRAPGHSSPRRCAVARRTVAEYIVGSTSAERPSTPAPFVVAVFDRRGVRRGGRCCVSYACTSDASAPPTSCQKVPRNGGATASRMLGGHAEEGGCYEPQEADLLHRRGSGCRRVNRFGGLSVCRSRRRCRCGGRGTPCGEAVLIADPVYVATLGGSEALRGCIDGAVNDGIDVSVCPRSVQARGIRQEQVAAIGAHPRPLADILVEVAEGRSVLVNV